MSSVTTRSWVKWAAVGGIVAPLLFAILVLVTGLLTPGFSQFSQTVSELGQVGQPYAVLMDANFVLTGLLVMGLVVGLRASFAPSLGQRLGPILLLAYPLAFILVGTIFPLPSPVHVPAGVVGFFITLVGMLAISWPMRAAASWKRLAKLTLLIGIVSIIGSLIFGFLQSQSAVASWLGLAQRLVLAPYFVWLEIVALRLFSISRSTVQTRGPAPA